MYGKHESRIHGFWWGDPRERERGHLQDLGEDGIILKLIFKKWNGEAWIAIIWRRIGPSGGHL